MSAVLSRMLNEEAKQSDKRIVELAAGLCRGDAKMRRDLGQKLPVNRSTFRYFKLDLRRNASGRSPLHF